jgi:hypothetical protein
MDDNKTPAGAQAPAVEGASEPTTKATGAMKATNTAVILSDGRTAFLRPAKGLDLEKGAAIVRGRATNPMALMMGVASVVTTIDGAGITYEEVQQLPIEDAFELIGVVMGNARVPSQL